MSKELCGLCNGRGKLTYGACNRYWCSCEPTSEDKCVSCSGKGYIEHSNSTVDDRERRHNLSCPHCRPNRGENQKRRPKHGKTKSKKKDHRR